MSTQTRENPRIKILTDSASDIPREEAALLGIDVIPIPITVDGQGYLEGVDFTPREFYPILEGAKSIPTTSQISPVTYIQHYHQAMEEGYTDVILVSFTSTASSTYSQAVNARELFYQNCPQARERIRLHLVDSKMFSIPYGYPTMQAARMVQEGKGVEEILSYLQDWLDRVDVYFTAFSFEYIKKSGRISCAAGVVGEALGIRPLIQIRRGQMKIVAKPRGNQAVLKKMNELLTQRIAPGSPYLMLQGTFEGAAQELTGMIQESTGLTPACLYDVGAAVSINSGPKMLGIAFLTDKD